MATNPALRKALLEKLDIYSSALSKRVKKLQIQAPMSTEDAVYLIAFQSGVKIQKFLTSEQVDRVRHLHTQVGHVNTAPAAPAPTTRASKKTAAATPREMRFPSGLKATDPLLSATKLNEALAMAEVYPVLYVLENSMRELTRRVMRAACGEDWWNTELADGKLKNLHAKVAGRMRSDEEKHSWHQRRGAHPIDYADIGDLESIILAKQTHFIPGIINRLDWYSYFMGEIYPSRNVVCHMNPLDADHIKDLELKFKKWENVIASALPRIPPA